MSSVKAAIISGVVVGILVWMLTWALMRNGEVMRPELKTQDWWEHTVIYQIYPRSFKDSDGDGIGDLKGITSELEHLLDAGVGAIWMSPIFKSPMIDFGYDISDFYSIHEEYGTMDDFDELVKKAHDLGLKVLLNFVPNHASTYSDYFIKSVAKEPGFEDFFVWANPRVDRNNPQTLSPTNWISQFGGSAWEWNERRQQFYLHQFAIEQADFNFRNQAVRKEIINIMIFWLTKGADGFRADTTAHLFEAPPDENGQYPNEPLSRNSFFNPGQPGYTTQIYVKDVLDTYDVIYEWREAVDSWVTSTKSDTKLLLIEAFTNTTMMMLYYGSEQGRLGAHFPFNYDLLTNLTLKSTAPDFVYIIQHWLTYMPKGKVANWVLGNHDHSRVASRFKNEMVDGLNALILLLPGVAVTYQGEEIGMKDGFVSWDDTVDVLALNLGNSSSYLKYSRDPYRTPYHWNGSKNAGFSTASKTWLPVAKGYGDINLQAQKKAHRSHYKVYQNLTKLRKHPSVSQGETFIKALSEYTLILIRHLGTYDTYGFLFNVGSTKDEVDLAEVALLRLPMIVYVSSVDSSWVNGNVLPLGNITLKPGEAIVFYSPRS